MREFIIAIFISLAFVHTVSAQVVINEISPRSDPEWVELYNLGDDPIDLTNWYLLDKASNKESLATLGIFSPHTYLVFTRPKGWLNDTTEEYLYLFDGVAQDPLDSLSYTSIKEGLTIARVPDLTGEWYTNQVPSMGFANFAPSPSPSPISSPSPSPSPSVTLPTPPGATTLPDPPTPVPSPSQLRSPTAQVKQLVHISPLPSDASVQEPPVGTVAGESIEVDLSAFGSPDPSGDPTLRGQSSQAPALNQSRAKSTLLVGTGLVVTSVAGFFGYRKYRGILM